MKLSEDKKTLHVFLNVSLSASEVEALIFVLCEFRADMKFAVPMARASGNGPCPRISVGKQQPIEL